MRLVPAVRSVIRAADRDQPIENIATMESLISDSMAALKYE